MSVSQCRKCWPLHDDEETLLSLVHVLIQAEDADHVRTTRNPCMQLHLTAGFRCVVQNLKKNTDVTQEEASKRFFTIICPTRPCSSERGILIPIVLVEYKISRKIHPFLSVLKVAILHCCATCCPLKMISACLKAELVNSNDGHYLCMYSFKLQ